MVDLYEQQEVIHSTVDQYLTNLTPDNLVIISPTSYQKLSNQCQQWLQTNCDIVFANVIQSMGIKSFATYRQVSDTVYAIGGGTAIDYAKYLAAHNGVQCRVIPSMLSTNAFATNKVAILENGHKHTENGVLPKKVILDESYLSQSFKENLYGLVDVYSIFIALIDWELAERNVGLLIDSHIYNKAKDLLVKAILLGDDIAQHQDNVDSINNIFKVVQEAGYLTNEYGSGRPESGSEHIFAAALESKCSIPHALSVTLGMHVMLYYYQITQGISHNWLKVFNCIPFSKLGIIDDINAKGLSWGLIQSVLKDMVPRPDKYTIVDTLDMDIVSDDLKQYLEYFGIALKPED